MAKQRMGTRQRLQKIDTSIHARTKRVRNRMLTIMRIAIAAGVAFWIAQRVFGHEQPFFAPMAVVIIVTMTGGERLKRAFDMSLGCTLGVLLGDLLFVHLGQGGWQIAVIVAGSLVVASFFSKSQLVSNQVAIGSILVATIMPPGASVTGVDRTIDAIVGATVAMLTLALLPPLPLARARTEIAHVMELMSSVLDDVAKGLRASDGESIMQALKAIRESQADIDLVSTAIRSGKESANMSPLLWGARRYVASLSRVLPPTDIAVRTTRVLARRASVLCDDNDHVTEKQLDLLDRLAKICLDISAVYEGRPGREQASVIPAVVHELRVLGAEAGMDVISDNPVLSEYAILAQTRSLIVDLLQVCGMSYESAVAVLVPTSSTPGYPPEVYRGE
ncbi:MULTISPECIES: FUSC family protein [unclassified Corynebacterium]|uniref:FUSC family protein n=1 Tax=unclassified Corynebacterium TaxID=2624378 RepID=UPI002A90DA29|nr:FUSC family protein [Corynebacterium sp.]MDY5784587.1 FUSC family protein [Corynebacterium sp.]